jgi:hypothetical protein
MSLPSSLLWPPSPEQWQHSGRHYALTWPRNLTAAELKSLLTLIKGRGRAEAKTVALTDWAQKAQISSFAIGFQSRKKTTFWLWGEVIALVEEKKVIEKEGCPLGRPAPLGLLRIYETASAASFNAGQTSSLGQAKSPKLLKVVLDLTQLESLLFLPTVYRLFYDHPEALLTDERALLTWLKRDGVEFLPLLLTQLDTPETAGWPSPALLSKPEPTLWRQNLKQLLAHAHEFPAIGDMEAEIDGWLS